MRYTVRSGDTLLDICRRFRVDVEEVIRLNPAITHSSSRLRVGQVIILPAAVTTPDRVPEPVIGRFIPAGAQVSVRVLNLSGGRIPERVIIYQLRDGAQVVSGIVVIRFTRQRGWHIVFTKKDVRLALRFLDKCRLLPDRREQVIIGSNDGTRSDLCFCVLGCRDKDVRLFVDRLHKPVPKGKLWIESNRIRIDSTTGQIFYSWNGTHLEERRY